MVKYYYPFEFNFNYELLKFNANHLSQYQEMQERTGEGSNYKKAEEGDVVTLRTNKLSLCKNKAIRSNAHNQSILNQCYRFFDAIGSEDNDVILLEYNDDCFLGWHIDNPPGVDYGRINLVITDNWKESPIIFKDGDKEVECPAKLSVVNAYRYEHRYDNRGKDKRILLCMTTHDLNYEECIDAVSSL